MTPQSENLYHPSIKLLSGPHVEYYMAPQVELLYGPLQVELLYGPSSRIIIWPLR